VKAAKPSAPLLPPAILLIGAAALLASQSFNTPMAPSAFQAGVDMATAIQGGIPMHGRFMAGDTGLRQPACVHTAVVACRAAKKKAAGGEPICDGDTVFIKVQTGRYIGELDGTSRKEWVKARGTKKDEDHALTIEKPGGGEVESGDMIKLVMPLTVTNGTKVHMDIVGSAVRARYYDPRGEWQKMTIVKQEGGTIRDGDKVFIRSVFKNGRDYMDANPLEKIADGEVKCRWPDEGEWQALTIEK